MKSLLSFTFAGLGALALVAVVLVTRQQPATAHSEATKYVSAPADPAAAAPTTQPAGEYPVTICPVSNQKLGSMGEPVVREYDNRTVKFCCAGCPPQFEKEKDKYMQKLDELVVEAQLANYPLETCPISGESLGGMGEPLNHVYRPTNQLVRFCCAGCVDAFEENPEPTLAKLNAAYEARAE